MSWPVSWASRVGAYEVSNKVPKVDPRESCPEAAPFESDLESAAGYMLETP